MFQASMLEPLNMIYGSAELSFLLINQNIAYNTELQNSEHYVLSLSKYFGHLETDIKMLLSSLKYFVYFIKQHPLGEHPIEQFSTILGVSSYVQNLCFFLIINLLHGAGLQSVVDYLQQVAYSFRGLSGQKPPSQADRDIITVRRDQK